MSGHWHLRASGFITCFIAGWCLVSLYLFAVGYFRRSLLPPPRVFAPEPSGCVEAAARFASPEDLLAALTSAEVAVRRDVYARLALRPGTDTAFYDYARDHEYPEPAEQATLRYLDLDAEPGAEAIVTFTRLAHPAAVILKRDACGWRAPAVVGGWLRDADAPETPWLELPETISPGTHELLLHESRGDAVTYERQARLLKLTDNALVEIARYDEEAITPVENYQAADWADVKRRRRCRAVFNPRAAGGARLRLDSSDEIVRYAGASPSTSDWQVRHGAWHTAPGHWRTRTATTLKTVGTHRRELIWSSQAKRFVEVE